SNTRNLRRCILRCIAKFAHNLDDGALTTFCCHPWRGKQIDTFLLVERANDDLKLWVRHNAGKTENSRRDRWSTSAKKQCIERVGTNSEVTAAVARGYGKLVRGRKGEVCWVGWRRGPPGANNFPRVTSDVKRSKQPIETKLLQIVLSDLDEFRLYLDLLRASDIRLFNERIHQFQIIDRVANNKAAALWQEVGAGAGRKWHALAFQ